MTTKKHSSDTKTQIGDFCKKNWAYLVIFAVILIYAISLINLYSSLKQLPSPIYGGDYYHQLGTINHAKYGGNMLSSTTTNGDTASYLPMYTILVGSVARFFGMSSMGAMYFMSVLFISLGLLVTYLALKKLTDNDLVGILGAVFYVPLTIGIIKYTEFARFLAYPLFFLFVILLLKSKTKKILYAILTGISYGLVSLSHGMGFIVFTLIVLILSFYLMIYRYFDFKTKKFDVSNFKKGIWNNLLICVIVFGIGFLISLLFWGKPLLSNNYSSEDIGINPNYVFTFSDIFGKIKNQILSFNSAFNIIYTLLFMVGVLDLLLFNKNSRKMNLYILGLIFVLLPLHFILTKPLFNITLMPNHMVYHIVPIGKLLVSSLGLTFLVSKFKPKVPKIAWTSFVAILILVFVILRVGAFGNFSESYSWLNTGRADPNPLFLEVSDYVIANTNVDDTFVSTKEISSAINAITGRKFVSLRYNHISHYDQYNFLERDKDLALFLYTNNSKVRSEIIDKYDIKYLYWDYYWIRSEFQLNDKGELVGFFDPILVMDTVENRALLDYNGIKYIESNMELDPSKRGVDLIKKFDFLVVLPSRFVDGAFWHESLEESLSLDKEFVLNNATYARIYSVN
jgi:hypothetical protein